MASPSTIKGSNLAQKWKLDVCIGRSGGSRGPISVGEWLNPPGYVSTGSSGYHGSESPSQQSQHLLTKRAWEMALAPMKQLPMNLFIMYMAGNSISIFPIMMVFMMAWRPIKAVLALSSTFKTLEDEVGNVLVQKFVFCLGNLLGIFLALYKCHSMGLLPTHASDWLDFVEAAERSEFATGAVMFVS